MRSVRSGDRSGPQFFSLLNGREIISLPRFMIPPFLRWAGSKRKLVPELRNYWNDAKGRYIEPFMGSACLFFAVQPRRAVLGDTNGELVRTFKAVRNDPAAVFHFLRPLRRDPQFYYAVRRSWREEQNSARFAARFIYLNRLCFNGIYRTNVLGEFNVPYGGNSTGAFPSLVHLNQISAALQGARICRSDFEQVLSTARCGDFVYLDPPYSVANRRIFKQYGPAVFGRADLERLASCLRQLDARGVEFVLSYALCEEALRLFKKWNLRRRTTMRNVSGFAKHRRQAVELIATNIPSA